MFFNWKIVKFPARVISNIPVCAIFTGTCNIYRYVQYLPVCAIFTDTCNIYWYVQYYAICHVTYISKFDQLFQQPGFFPQQLSQKQEMWKPKLNDSAK